MADFAYVSSRLGDVAPATLKIAEEIFYAAQAAGHEIWFMWGMGSGPEHSTGRALDLMVRNEAGGDFVRDYIWANRARLRLLHVIWEQHITSTTVNPGYRRPMEDRGNPTANHYDHVHTLHFAGDYQPPSTPPPSGSKTVAQIAAEVIRGDWGNGQDRKNRLAAAGYNYDAVQAEVNRQLGNVAPPSPAPVVVLKVGSQGAEVRYLQSFFRRVFPAYRDYVSVYRGRTIDVDGYFGSQTEAWVKEFQRRVGISQDGVVGKDTRAHLRRFGYEY